jgi:hypothetical protein
MRPHLSLRLFLRSLAVFAAALASHPASAVEHDFQQWTLLVAQGPVKDRLLVQGEIQPRLNNGASRLGQFQISPALGYRLNKRTAVYVGYMFVHTDPVGRPAFDENRLYQHVVFQVGKIGNVALTTRTRIEARTVVGAEDLGWRFRQQVRAQLPLREASKPLIVVWSELFYNLNDADWGPLEGIDRWRNFVGVAVPLGKELTLEPGYLNQAVFRPGEDRLDHIASVTMSYRF